MVWSSAGCPLRPTYTLKGKCNTTSTMQHAFNNAHKVKKRFKCAKQQNTILLKRCNTVQVQTHAKSASFAPTVASKVQWGEGRPRRSDAAPT